MNQYMLLNTVILMIIPWMALLINVFCFKKNEIKRARYASLMIGIGFITSLIALIRYEPESGQFMAWGFKADGLFLTMSSIIFFVSVVVHHFSSRYMAGDQYFKRYFIQLSAITGMAILMTCADSLLLLWVGWISCNVLLVRLMIHKKAWNAARESGLLACKSLMAGALLLLIAFVWLYAYTGSSSISFIIAHPALLPKDALRVVLLLIMLGALIQSAQWPFHKWLTSSLNSPTPISALMHAGLVNAGGFIVVRFAMLFLSATDMLAILFLMGFITTFIGTFWKLIQTDIKRMLASSTMAQMGFMMMQCGLGLFPAAIAHLCWHGLFKSFLFLNAGSAAKQKRLYDEHQSNRFVRYSLSLGGGFLGAYCFAIQSEKSLFTWEPTTFLVGIALIAGTQMAYSLLGEKNSVKRLIAVGGFIACAGLFYGASIHFIESFFPELSRVTLPHLNVLHGIAWLALMLVWFFCSMNGVKRIQHTRLWKRLYVGALNGSQPHPKTITAIRQHYQYNDPLL